MQWKINLFLLVSVFQSLSFSLSAQGMIYFEDEKKSIEQVEEELYQLMVQMYKDSVDKERFKKNDIFKERLFLLLHRVESFSYPFKKLADLFKVSPADSSFRIYTWAVSTMGGTYTHYGFLQIPIRKEGKLLRVKVIRLHDRVQAAEDVERRSFTPEQWLGAVYYYPRYSDHGVLTFEGKIMKINPITGKRKKEKVKYYVLFGWNGHNRWTNYKILETIVIEDTNKIYFGAPIFYHGGVPKYRVVLKYTDNAHVTLNLGYIILKQRKLLWKRAKPIKAIVFDHIAMPKNTRYIDPWMAGPDGTYDAFYFYNKKWIHLRKGGFYYIRNVLVYDESIEHYDPKVIKQLAEQEKAKFQRYGIPWK